MKSLLVVIAGIALAATIAAAQAQDAARLLKSAMNTELVDGNLKLAIEQYEAVVATGDRVHAAQALLHMAGCYQKLGDAQAQTIYARLLREYGDQKDAVATARARLGPAATGMANRRDRQIWKGADTDGFGTISQDGRYLTYTDWRQGGRLVLRDLSTGSDRPLTDSAQGWTQFSVISKNGSDVAYQWKAQGDTTGAELRVSSLHAAGSVEPRRFQFSEDIRDVAPFDWSADGQWLSVEVSRADRTNQIGLVKVTDGSLRILKSTDWKEPGKIFFSPDGRYIAYDLPVSETSNSRHVFVMAVDGSQESTVVAHESSNVMMGWSVGGQQLLFASDRGGTTGLWAAPIADGRSIGAPTLVQPDIAASWSLGTTAAGSLFVWRDRRGLSVRTAPINLTTAKLSNPVEANERFIRSRGRPAWSRDGTQLAYHSCNGLGGGPCDVMIWSLVSGKARELPTSVRYQQAFDWSPDGRDLIAAGADFKGRPGIYRIDTNTGDASAVVLSEAMHAQWASDGRSIYYRRRDAQRTLVIMQHDLAAGTEREVLRTPADNGGFLVSPDGRSVAYSARDAVARTVQVIGLGGGKAKTVLEVATPEEIYPMSWTPDSSALLIVKLRDGNTTELWLAPVSGEKPRRIEGDVTKWTPDGGVRLSPDGTQLTFVHAAGEPGYEIWALENYLSSLGTRK